MNFFGGQFFGGGFLGALASPTAPTGGGARFFAYPSERSRKKPTVEIAVQRTNKPVVKYISMPAMPDASNVMLAIEGLTRLIETRARHVDVQALIREIEEEEDVIIVMSIWPSRYSPTQ